MNLMNLRSFFVDVLLSSFKGVTVIRNLFKQLFDNLICYNWFVTIVFYDAFRNWAKQLKSREPSLIRAVGVTFWKEYALFSLLVGFNDIILRLAQPLLIGQMLLYFRLVGIDSKTEMLTVQ